MNKNNLRTLRKLRNLKVEDISTKLHITSQFYYQMESGTSPVNSIYLKKFADLFDTSIDYILCRVKNPDIALLTSDSLPTELAEYVDLIEICKDAVNDGISKDDVKMIIGLIKRLRSN